MATLEDALADGQIVTTPSGTQYQFVASQNRVKRIPGAGQSRPPSITSFTPNPVSVGSSLSIVGTNFVFSSANTSVDFSKSGGGRTLSQSVTVSTNTSISAVVPADAVDGPVVVTTLDGAGTSAGTLQIQQFSSEAVTLFTELLVQGYTVPAAEKLAIDNFFIATNSLRSAVIREYGFVGGTFNAHKVNWNSPGNNHCTAIGTVTHNSLGIKCADASAMDTGYNIEASKQNSIAMLLYLTEVPVSNIPNMGAMRFGSGLALTANNAPNYGAFANNGLAMNINNGNFSKGIAAVSRTSSTASHARYAAGTATSTVASSDPGSFYDTSLARILIGAINSNGGTFNGGASPAMGHATIFNRGVTQAELTTYSNAVIALQAALGRD
jgi:hypothetical protein